MTTSQITNLAPIWDASLVKETLRSYFKENSISGVLSLADVGNADIRRILLHEMSLQNTTYHQFNQNSLMEFFKSFGCVRKSTQAYKIGYVSRARLRTLLNATGAIGGAASESVKWTLTSDYSPTQGAAVDIDDVVEIGETRFQVQVIGIDTGAADLAVYGVDDNGVPITPGSAGGAAGAHVIVVAPLQQEIVPAITSDMNLVVMYDMREESNGPTNGIMVKKNVPLEFGNSMITTTVRSSGSARSTASAGEVSMQLGDKKIRVVASETDVDDFIMQQYKIIGAVLFGQKATNTTNIKDTHVKQNNGIFTQAQVNGAPTVNYTIGSFTFAVTMNRIIDLLYSVGIKEANWYIGDTQFAEVQLNVAPAYWKDNIRITPVRDGDGSMTFNYDTSAITVRGIKLNILRMPHSLMTSDLGLGYKNTGLVMPMMSHMVTDPITKKQYQAMSINVYFKEDDFGNVRDENYMQTDGGAGSPSKNAVDNYVKKYLADLTTMCVGMENAIYVQGI